MNQEPLTGKIGKALRRVAHDLSRPGTLGLWLASAVLVSLGGPFGSYEAVGFGGRLIYWAVMIGAAIFLGRALRHLWRVLWTGAPEWLIECAAVASFVPIYAPLGWVFTRAWVDPDKPLPIGFWQFATIVALVSASLTAVLALAVAQATPAPEPGQDRDQDRDRDRANHPRPPLLARLPQDRQGQIMALSAQDHYVHVATDLGRVKLLMRFADALAQLDGLDGVQVHRSHWVAAWAVAGLRKEPGRLFVVLTDGTELPVSRRFRPDAEARFGAAAPLPPAADPAVSPAASE